MLIDINCWLRQSLSVGSGIYSCVVNITKQQIIQQQIIDKQQTMNYENYVEDSQFLRIAYKLGYTQQDFKPISESKVQSESGYTLSKMSEIERRYYIDKKVDALVQRRTKILQRVYAEFSKSKKTTPVQKFNPIVSKLLVQHQKTLKQNKRYEEITRVGKSRYRPRASQTIDLGRTSPNFSQCSNRSQLSRKSVQSSVSSRGSQRSSSHQSRLMLVRGREKEVQKFKKNELQQHEQQSYKKLLNVYHSRQSTSRKIKIRSQISHQAVNEKKAELDFIKNQQIRNHLENMKYRMVRNELIKEKQIQQRSNQMRSVSYQVRCKQQMKRVFDDCQRLQQQENFARKMSAAKSAQKEVKRQKRSEVLSKAQQRSSRQARAQEFKKYAQKEMCNQKEAILYFEKKSQEHASDKRNAIKHDMKMRRIEEKVKEQIVRSNLKSIERQNNIRLQEKVREFTDKMKQIKEIDSLKGKLARQRKGVRFNGRKYAQLSMY